MAQNEMKAKPALPKRVRSMKGLGVTAADEQNSVMDKLICLPSAGELLPKREMDDGSEPLMLCSLTLGLLPRRDKTIAPQPFNFSGSRWFAANEAGGADEVQGVLSEDGPK